MPVNTLNNKQLQVSCKLQTADDSNAHTKLSSQTAQHEVTHSKAAKSKQLRILLLNNAGRRGQMIHISPKI